ncbi:MAG: hypothetical protein PUB49_00980 [Selenomonadaceae bacterium]|nr:hypothetical protein [Selenomonadaceae bacterium]
MAKQNPWLGWQEVARIFECSRTKAYVIIRRLNNELKEKGFLTYNGRVSRKYFNERYYGQL